MRRDTLRRRFGWWLRMLGDRVSPDTGPRAADWSFTIEPGSGFMIREGDRQGCPLWFNAEDYHRAHDEADTEHTVVLWENVAEDRQPFTRRAGGRP